MSNKALFVLQDRCIELRELLQQEFGESSFLFFKKTYGLILASLVMTLTFTYFCYFNFDFNQIYSELVVGSISWTFSSKTRDYFILFFMFFCFIMFFTFFLLMIIFVQKRLFIRLFKLSNEIFALSSSPFFIFIAGLLSQKEKTEFFYLEVAACAIVITSNFFLLLQSKDAVFWKADQTAFFRILEKTILFVILFYFAACALCVATSRFFIFLGNYVIYQNLYLNTILILHVLTLLYLARLICRSQSINELECQLNVCITKVQWCFPIFLLTLIPVSFWKDGSTMTSAYPMTDIGYICIAFFMFTFTAHNMYKTQKIIVLQREKSLSVLITIPTLITILLFLKSFNIGLPNLSPDDYHFGELILPWYSLIEFGQIPFWDLDPARGFINYFCGLINAIIFDGTAASLMATKPFCYLFLLLLVVPILVRMIGVLPTFFSLYFMVSINFISEIDTVVTAYLCLCILCMTRYSWIISLPIVYICSLLLLMWAPGQGGLACVAISPVAGYIFFKAFTKQKKRVIIILGFFLLITCIIGITTPLGKMVFGSLRYGLEQSSLNAIANGIGWERGYKVAPVNFFLYQVIICSWLFVPFFSVLLLAYSIITKDKEYRNRILISVLPICILTVLFIVRAAGRIDSGSPSRLGIASIWALSLLLPIFIFYTIKPKSKGPAVIIWFFLVGLVLPFYGTVPKQDATFSPKITSKADSRFVDGRAIGIKNVGSAFADGKHIARLQTIKSFLDSLLDKNETYLDMSSRNAHYFYFERKPPIASSIYNLVGEKQQERAIMAFKREKPPLVLLSANNINHDGGGASLRSHLLYRFLMTELGYQIVQMNGTIWLISPKKAEKLRTLRGIEAQVLADARENPVHMVYKISNLQAIPSSWGRSSTSLMKKLTLKHAISSAKPSYTHSVAVEKPEKFKVTGSDPYVGYDISNLGVSGRDAGILSFTFLCQKKGDEPVVEVFWGTDNTPPSNLTRVTFRGIDGQMLVPLDASPAWLLADRIKELRFDVTPDNACESYSIHDIKLLQRTPAN